MWEVFFYSIAGAAQNDTIDALIQKLLSIPYIDRRERGVLNHCMELSARGNYPSASYFSNIYADSGVRRTSFAELTLEVDRIINQVLISASLNVMVEASNESLQFDKLRSTMQEFFDNTVVEDSDLDRFKCLTYSDVLSRPATGGILTGIEAVDDLTNGFQPGCVGSICAFTGNGKTITWVSILYKAVMSGKRCVYLSLEMDPMLIWMMLEARYMYEVHGLSLSSQDLIMRSLPENTYKEVKSHEPEFFELFNKNMLVTDSTVFPKAVATSSAQIKNLYSKFEGRLGGLDMVVYDHVNQLDKLFPELGNIIIKQITDACVTWHSKEGTQMFTGFAVQCNRAGYMRALRNQGDYDVTAISDLNEVERSSTYIIFLLLNTDSLHDQSVVVSFKKHRLGSIMLEPVQVPFTPAVALVGSNVENITSSGDEFGGFDFSASSSTSDSGDFF